MEARGWRIYRVWSTEWYRNRADAELRLLKAVEQAQSQAAASLIDPPNPPAPKEINLEAFATDTEFEDPTIPAYEIARDLSLPPNGELHLAPPSRLARLIEEIVTMESPVHFDEVVRRLRVHWGVGRAGARIRDAIQRAVGVSIGSDRIREKHGFLWQKDMRTPPLRRRSDDPPANIARICAEEIAEAVKHVLGSQFATPPEDLAVRTARVLGINSTRKRVSSTIAKVVESMLSNGDLKRLADGNLDLASRHR